MSDLERFDVLVGAWDTEATHPLLPGVVVAGHVTFEWLGDRRFLVQRTRHDHELLPDALGVIGAPQAGDGLLLEYFDSRGVRRTYGVSLVGGVLRMWRDHPGFDQRLTAALAPDRFELLCEVAEEPGAWREDLRAVHTRVPRAGRALSCSR